MLCIVSFLIVFITIIQLERGDLTNWQAGIYAFYGLLMFYYTSKPFWEYKERKSK